MVLCAGHGTRLRPLTDELPKPLVPLGDRPILGHVADALARAGITSAVVNTHHLPEQFDRLLDTFAITLQAIHEPEIRGTAGGVAGARAWLDPPPVLVVNGDILVEPPVGDLFAAVGDGLALGVAPRPCGEGPVGLDRDGFVVRLRGERFGEECRGGDYVGVAALGARVLEVLPVRGCLIGDVALPALRAGRRIASASVERWRDAGDLASYHAANLEWLSEHAPSGAWLGPDARVGQEVRLEDCLIGAGASVTGRGLVHRAVVWPGANARAPLENVVVTTRGRIVTIA
jgi:mannose-1-phosphate guanylyltransferase